MTTCQQMARTQDMDKRRQLAREAVVVLQRDGLDASTASLAAALGIKRPTLLYYFPTREAIVETALVDLLAEQAQFVLAKILEHDHPIDQLYAQVRAVHAFHHGHEARVVFLSQAIAAFGVGESKVIEIGNAAFEAQRGEMRKRLRLAIRQGRMHACDPDALVRLVRATIDGLMVQRVMTGCDLAPVHKFLWQHVLRPLKRDPEKS